MLSTEQTQHQKNQKLIVNCLAENTIEFESMYDSKNAIENAL